MLYEDEKELVAAIEHIDPEYDWGCDECHKDHENLRRWLLELQERRFNSEQEETINQIIVPVRYD